MRNISIIGCGGHARCVANTIFYNEKDVHLTFYDENARSGEKIFGDIDVLGMPLDFDGEQLFIAIGDNMERMKFAQRYEHYLNLHGISIVSRSAHIGKFVDIGLGSYVSEGAYIGPEVVIGKFSIINSNAVVAHEARIGNFSHISVNATVSGRCNIGNNVFLGGGAVVRDKVSICDSVVIGAGGVVCKDISESGIYIGCPVKKIKEI